MTTLLTFYLSRIKNGKVHFSELHQTGVLIDILVDVSNSRPKAIAVLVKLKDRKLFFDIVDFTIRKDNLSYHLTCSSSSELKIIQKDQPIYLVKDIHKIKGFTSF